MPFTCTQTKECGDTKSPTNDNIKPGSTNVDSIHNNNASDDVPKRPSSSHSRKSFTTATGGTTSRILHLKNKKRFLEKENEESKNRHKKRAKLSQVYTSNNTPADGGASNDHFMIDTLPTGGSGTNNNSATTPTHASPSDAGLIDNTSIEDSEDTDEDSDEDSGTNSTNARRQPWKDPELQRQGRKELLKRELEQNTAQRFDGDEMVLGKPVLVRIGISEYSERPGWIVRSTKPCLGQLQKGLVRVQLQDEKNHFRIVPRMAQRPMEKSGRNQSRSKGIPSLVNLKSVLADHVVMPVAGLRLRRLHFAKYMDKSIPAKLMELPNGTYGLIDNQNFQVDVYKEWIEQCFPHEYACELIETLRESKGEWVEVKPGCRVKDGNQVEPVSPTRDYENDKPEHRLQHMTKDSEYACSYGSAASVMAEYLKVNTPKHLEIQGQIPELIMDLGRSLPCKEFFSNFKVGMAKILRQRAYVLERIHYFDPYHSSEVPVMAELVGIDDEGNTSPLNHIVCFLKGHVYESTWPHSKKCTIESGVMDEICSGLGYRYHRLKKIYKIRPSNDGRPSKALLLEAEARRMAPVVAGEHDAVVVGNKRKQSAAGLTTGDGKSYYRYGGAATGDGKSRNLLLLNGRFEPPSTKRICLGGGRPSSNNASTWIRRHFQPRDGLSWDDFWSKSMQMRRIA